MHVSVVIELDEGLELHPEPSTVIQNRMVMIGNAPRPRIEVETRIELAMLGRSAELRVDVAASQRPVSPARTEVEFENIDFVTRAPELDRRRHAGEAGAQNDDRSPFGVALELDRAAVRRFRREAEPGHELVGRGPADARAYELKKPPPAHSPSTDERLRTGSGGRRAVAHRLSRLPSAAMRTISLTGSEDDLKKAGAEEPTLAP